MDREPDGPRLFYRMRGLGKRYLDNLALDDINISFSLGRVSGLIGKNGAGKSTLVNIMYGALEQTEGSINIDGREVGELTPGKAQNLGVFLVPQKIQHARSLTIAENLFLGRYPRTAWGSIHVKRMREEAEAIMARVGLRLTPNLVLDKLNIEQRRLLDVAKALWVYDARMLILDETTAALSIRSKETLFRVIREETTGNNRSIVFITHRLREIMEICNDVFVLRDGRNVGYRRIGETTVDELAEMIIGKGQDVAAAGSATGASGGCPSGGEPCLEAIGLSLRGIFSDVGFSISRNEIIGVVGMLGSGYNDILRCLGGVVRDGFSGRIRLDGREVAVGTPEKLNRAGISYLTNNREEEGLFHTMTIEQNMFLGAYRHFRNRLGFLDKARIRRELAAKAASMDIKMHSPSLLIDSLSGGNKQKVMVSRLLNQRAEILLFDEIAEGIDIESRSKLLRFIDETARNGRVIIMASNVVEDLITICDRILIINHGHLSRAFTRGEFDEQEIYSAIQGLAATDDPPRAPDHSSSGGHS